MNILIILLLVVVFIVIAISKFKVHPFIALLLSSVLIGFFIGLDGNEMINKINEGFGNTLSSIGIIIGFGSIVGAFLEKSGGTSAMAKSILKLIGEKRSPWAINLTGVLVSIPVYCDSGFVILSSLNKALSKKTGIPLVVYAVALSTGLYVAHVFIPPTPGPLAAASILKADLGLVILFGIALSIPVAFVGYLWAKKSGANLKMEGVKSTEDNTHIDKLPDESKKNILLVFSPIIVPIILIALRSLANYPSHIFGEGMLYNILHFIGNPLVALFIGVLFSSKLIEKKINMDTRLGWVSNALKEAGVIILITGAGGAFGNVLKAGDIGQILESDLSGLQIGILLPFLLAAILKTAQGSSTVAIITSATIIAPLMSSLGLHGEFSRALTVLAIGAGAMTVSHINDSYFWVVSQFSGLDTKTTLKSHTMATLLQGVSAISMLSIIQLLIN
ncbi:MAG: GntP family permease [Cyclobacteriaceae bacterium]|nr:GntP family permease [Cyclobacteriaceae bacterium]